MPKDLFIFKHFTIRQSYKDVMKVSTDSVLLGCFADIENLKEGVALDIGSGTGILSLMLAQKNTALKITAIDNNVNAFQCSQNNFQNSQYADRLNALHISLEEFVKVNTQKFDLIISNPPYFSKSLKSYYSFKNNNRHQNNLNYETLLNAVIQLLKEDGSFYTIVPYYEQKRWSECIGTSSLHVHKILSVYSHCSKTLPYLFLYKVGKKTSTQISQHVLYIQNSEGYTKEYIQYTQMFYLDEKLRLDKKSFKDY